MAEGSSVEISVGTDPIAEKPGMFVKGKIQIGGGEVESEVTRIAAILSGDLEDLTGYVVIPCTDDDAATQLASTLSDAWQEAGSLDPHSPLPALARAAKGDSDEENLAVISFVAVGNRVLAKISLGSDRFEQVNGMLQMGEMSAGTILENSQVIEFSLNHNKLISEILASPASLALTVPNGVQLKIFLKLWESLASEVSNIGDQFGLPPPIKAAIAAAGLYKGLDLKLNFRSPEVLPKGLRDRFIPSESNEIEMVKGMVAGALPDLEKRVLQAICTHASGQGHAFIKVSKIVASFDVDVTGLSAAFF